MVLEFDEFAGAGGVGGLDAGEIETRGEGAGVDGYRCLRVLSGLGLVDCFAVDVIDSDL